MELTGRESSHDSANSLSFLSAKVKKKKNNCSGSQKDEFYCSRSPFNGRASIKFQIRDMGPICEARKKAAEVFPKSSEDDEQEGGFVSRLEEEGWPDDDCMWLSSGSASLSCFTDYRFSSLMDMSIDEWFISLLSMSGNSSVFWGKAISLFDGSRVNPIEEASLVLEKTTQDEDETLPEGLKEEEVVTWLLSSIENDFTDSTVTCSENVESACGQYLEDFITSDSSISSLNASSDSRSRSSHSDGTGFWVSAVNPDGGGSNWILDTESELDYFQSDFPSPPLKSSWVSEVEFSNSMEASRAEVNHERSDFVALSDRVSDAACLEDFNNEEPLFWPPDGKSDWSSEVTWDLLIMSPRKDKHNVGTPEGISSKSFRLRLHNRRPNMKEECKRTLVFRSGSASSKILELKCRDSSKDVRRVNTMPSRFSRNSTGMLLPIDHKEGGMEATELDTFTTKSDVKLSLLEDGFASDEELPIERLLGLDEFDGHEGVESEFNEEDFSLGECF